MSTTQRDPRDLADLLAELGTQERAAADPLDVQTLLDRARRRRAVRGTTFSAIGVAAAAAIAVGAASVDDLWRDRPLPPADTPTATSTPDPVVTPDPTRDPGAEETADAVDPHPAVDDLVISPAGLGPLVFGVPLEDNPGAAMLEYDPDHCSSPALEDAGDPARWVAAYEPVLEFDYYGGDELHAPFYVRVDADDAMVKRIDLWTDRIATSGGIRLGSSLAELQAAHPGVVEETEADDWSRAWVLRSDAGTLVFETIDRGAEGTDLVVGIRAYGPGLDPDLHTTSTDNVAGGCL